MTTRANAILFGYDELMPVLVDTVREAGGSVAAVVLLVMGRMEQRGRGWPIVRRVMREFNGSEPELVEDRESRFVSVTLWLSITSVADHKGGTRSHCG